MERQNEMQNEISLLWKNGGGHSYFELPLDAQKDLDIDYICSHVSADKKEIVWIKNIIIKLCTNPENIRYRSEIFEDITNNNNLRTRLSELVKELRILNDFDSVKMTIEQASIWELINRLNELYSYIVCIENFKECLQCESISSEGLKQVKDLVDSVYEGSGFQYLKEDISRLTEDVARIRSLTLGVNLDGNLNPTEVKLISMNNTTFKDKDSSVLKSLANAFADGLANSVVRKTPKVIDPLMNALTHRVEELLKGTVKDLKATLNNYVDVRGYSVTKLIPELIYYIRFSEMTTRISEMGLPITKAKIDMNSRKLLNLKEFYSIKLALHNGEHKGPVVKNDLIFDENHGQFILTGPNRGGKTILTQGVGLLVLFAQNGLYVPGKEVIFSPFDNIYTHFPADENSTVELGRLGEESKRIYNIIDQASSNSLVLLNESLSTTTFNEGLFIAKDVVKALSYLGARVIYNTHMHELAMELEELNSADDRNTVVSVVMGIEGGERNYKLSIAPPTGNSYAKDIAKKYGILFEQLKEKIDGKK